MPVVAGVGFGLGLGLGVCAFTPSSVMKNQSSTVVNRRKFFDGRIDRKTLSAGNVWTRRDTEHEGCRRNSGVEKLRRYREDNVENPTVTLLTLGAVVL